jgi:ATP-dependent Clp protease ATP-binding subunit ClpA
MVSSCDCECEVVEDEEAVKRLFTPDFRNRLDATIAFSVVAGFVGRVVGKACRHRRGISS